MDGKDVDKTAGLLNPAYAVVGTRGGNRDMANSFADWLVREDGGQKVISEFAVNGVELYTKAPASRKKERRVGNE